MLVCSAEAGDVNSQECSLVSGSLPRHGGNHCQLSAVKGRQITLARSELIPGTQTCLYFTVGFRKCKYPVYSIQQDFLEP